MIFRVSKASFDEARDRIFGKIKDVTNKDEELESRIKIIERKIQEDILRNKLAPQTPDDKKKQSNMFVPNMDGIHKRFSDIDGYIDSLRRNIKSIDQRLKKEITLLTDTKSDKHAQKELEKETEMIKIKLDKLDLNVHQNKEDLETRMNLIEKESIPRMEDKVKLHEEITHINTNRIENIELKYEQLSKIIAKISSDEFDVTVVDRMEDKLKKFANQINIFRGDFETTIKEIRNILYTKADDESITDLENKVLLKLNELVENICK